MMGCWAPPGPLAYMSRLVIVPDAPYEGPDLFVGGDAQGDPDCVNFYAEAGSFHR